MRSKPRNGSPTFVGVAVVAAILCGVAALRLIPPGHPPLHAGLAVVTSLAALHQTHLPPHRRQGYLEFLPFARGALRAQRAFLASAVVLVAGVVDGVTHMAALSVAACVLVGTLLGEVVRSHLCRRATPLRRIAVLGSAQTAADLDAKLRSTGIRAWEVVGHLHDTEPGQNGNGPTRWLGTSSEHAQAIIRDRIDLLLMSPELPRLALLERLAGTCLHAPTRVLELTQFYERTFGHVPLCAINAAWFQYLLHPDYRRGTSAGKRAFDLTVSSLLAVPAGLVIAILALLVRLDGGPVFYSQTRIGESGKPFRIYKMRSMRVDGSRQEAWSVQDDCRVTRVGRFMRRTHLDELPQLFNVIRGDMSLVGPRPEQPSLVSYLEERIPYYDRRHLVRPGITGWAQVQCGYAGSDLGSTLKACYDLYYIRHRSAGLDFCILLETVRTLIMDRQWPILQSLDPFVLAQGSYAPNGLAAPLLSRPSMDGRATPAGAV